MDFPVKNRPYLGLFLLPALALLAQSALTGCSAATTEDTSDETYEGLSLGDDDLNGLWITTVDGQKQTGDSMIESWPAAGIRLDLVDGSDHALTRSGDTLTEGSSSLAIEANSWYPSDDVIEGTAFGHTIHLKRDYYAKKPITLKLPGDRPFRSFLLEELAPAAQQDRESYTIFHASKVGAWLHTCELYKHGSWQYKYLKGSTWSERNAAFASIVTAVDHLRTTPHRLTKEKKFTSAITANLKDPSLAGLAISTFSMYFSTAAGRSVRLPITSDSMAYFITDRPARAERIGVVAMQTPLHGPLASTFGRQLLDMGAMPASDDAIYARTMMDLLAKSDPARASQLSPTGRSAITDWYAVMAIEDYRGMAFGWPTLGWGYNMTSAQFYGLVVRALARPGQKDSAGDPITGQVIVGNQLRPGDPSYADVLNNGADMQEYPDMSTLKVLATDYLRDKHPELVAAVESAFSGIVPKSELDWRAQQDIFHYVCAELYDAQNRTANLKGASADAAVDAVAALIDALDQESTQFEAYVLAHGITKSNDPAPKSTGY